jgi:hypothetical protein
MTAFVIPNAIQITTHDTKYTFASFLSRDTTFDVITNIWKLSHPRSPRHDSLGSDDGGSPQPGSPPAAIAAGLPAGGALGGAAAGAVKHKATICACGKSGQHYSEVPMEVVVPGTPEKVYNLMFASGFIKDFMANDQKLFGEFFCFVLVRWRG